MFSFSWHLHTRRSMIPLLDVSSSLSSPSLYCKLSRNMGFSSKKKDGWKLFDLCKLRSDRLEASVILETCDCFSDSTLSSLSAPFGSLTRFLIRFEEIWLSFDGSVDSRVPGWGGPCCWRLLAILVITWNLENWTISVLLNWRKRNSCWIPGMSNDLSFKVYSSNVLIDIEKTWIRPRC